MAETLILSSDTPVETPDAPDETSAKIVDETAETLAEAATNVAEIEAARDIRIAEIRAETERLAIQASERDAAYQTELATCRANIEALTTSLATMTAELQSMREVSTRPPLTEPLTNPPEPAGSADPTRDNPGPPEEKVRKKKPHRWI